jgi:hypothetical protein
MVRHEWLDPSLMETIEEARDHATQRLRIDNSDRPNTGSGGITPAVKLKMVACILRRHPAKTGGLRADLSLSPDRPRLRPVRWVPSAVQPVRAAPRTRTSAA